MTSSCDDGSLRGNFRLVSERIRANNHPPHLPSLPSRGNIVAPLRDGEGVVPRAKLGRCIIHLYALLDRGDFCTIFRLNFFSPIFPSFPFFGGKGDD